MKMKHSSIILAVAGTIGVFATAYFTARATPRAIERCVDDCDHMPSDFFDATLDDKVRIVKSLAKSYAPAIACGLATSTCIFGSHILTRKQQASIASAYMMLDRSYKEYQKRVEDIFGEGSNQKIRAEQAKESYDSTFCPSPGEQLFYDYCTGTYFESTLLAVVDAEYQLNRKLAVEGVASLRDYCDMVGIDCGEFADKRGWSVAASEDFYPHSWIDFEHELVIQDDGMECYVIYMPTPPIVNYLDK